MKYVWLLAPDCRVDIMSRYVFRFVKICGLIISPLSTILCPVFITPIAPVTVRYSPAAVFVVGGSVNHNVGADTNVQALLTSGSLSLPSREARENRLSRFF